MKDDRHNTGVREHILATAQAIMNGKGFSAVGLNEILKASDVPKGSFYHYFRSKEEFGKALLERYFETYLAAMDEIIARDDLTGAEKLLAYWGRWLDSQTADDPQSKCLVVKLAAEVSDLSEAMRRVLLDGTGQITGRIAEMIEAGIADGSLRITGQPHHVATSLYQSWLGASLLAKITRDGTPLRAAMTETRNTLG
ncbi:TetR/AcrR family transcriptional regulator [Halodurantibacterium flavum]|uniref:TetR/AcrR family transcriptional regulator n=1 Tax=Halodurantibacterium flavum TaxID=1382802 RepID=A0ABW4S8N0_9RHOB